MIVAKKYKSTKFFGRLFNKQDIEKIYLAICQGVPKNLSSIVKLKINKKNNTSSNMQTITKYKVIANSGKISLILFKPLTGKTHQLRIVSKYLNCPIIGDTKYNKKNIYTEEKLKLNASYLKLNTDNAEYEFKAPIPFHFINFMKKKGLRLSFRKKFEDISKFF